MACGSSNRWGRHAAVGCLLAVLAQASPWTASAARAQGAECRVVAGGPPARQILHCRDGLTVEAEAGADFSLLDRDGDARPDAASLRGGALLIDAPARPAKRRFEILTPQAVAAVRGTQWAVDVRAGTTAVFVVVGQVEVRRARLARGVILGPGQGVDVDEGTGPLTVRRWPAPRVSALLARFGR